MTIATLRNALLLVILVHAASATTTHATTWRVEKDGSGHSVTIQGAIDMAAPGDTVRIGPGRYDDPEVVSCPGWTREVQVLVDKDNLVLIGSGSSTIIGQEEWWEESQGYHLGIVASDGWGCFNLTIDSLRIENSGGAIYSSHEGSGDNELRFIDCEIHGSESSMVLIGDGGRVLIDGCVFTKTMESGQHLGAWYQSQLTVTNSVFRQWDVTPGSQRHIGLWGVEYATIEHCEFHEGDGGIGAIYSERVDVTDCLLDGQSIYGIAPSAGETSIYIDSCRLLNQQIAVNVRESTSLVHMSDSVVEGVGYCAVGIINSGPLTVERCDLDGGDHGVVNVVEQLCGDIGLLTMTNNYWGTADPDSIAALINDHNDSEDRCYEVIYEPFASESTPVVPVGLSDLKSLFR